MKDLAYALRSLLKTPGFSVIAVLSLTLGIGLNASVFSLVDAAFLRSWPARDPQHLARMLVRTPSGEEASFSYPEYLDLRRQAASFSGVLAFSRHSRFLASASDTRLILVDVVSPDYFAVLGLDPIAGRTFFTERSPEQVATVVISYDLWQTNFGKDHSLIGKMIKLSGRPHIVIGVAPPGFRGLERQVPTDAWLSAPEELDAKELLLRDNTDYELLARLKSETTVSRAHVEVESISRALAQTYPAGKDRIFTLVPEAERLREAVQPSLFLMACVGLVLLVACANVAGLVLARAEGRRREIAIRTALGASSRDLLRLLLAEGLLLSLAGGALGLLLTRLLIQAQPAFMPPAIVPLQFNLRAGGPVLLFTILISLISTLLLALVPALGASRPDLVTALKGESQNTHLSGISFRNLLVVGQIAVAVLLLSASGLLVHSLINTMYIRPGFDADRHLVFFSLSPGLAGYNQQQRNAAFHQLANRVASIPGVRQASFANRALLSGSGGGAARKVEIPGVDLPSRQKSVNIKFNAVDRNYFRTVGTAILEGRGFTAADEAPSSRTMLVDRTMAQRYWPDTRPLGKHVTVDGNDFEIIGVTEPTRIIHIHEDPEPYMYFVFSQSSGDATLIAETSGNPGAIIPEIRQAVHSLDRNLPILQVFTVIQLMHSALWSDRITAGLVSSLGVAGMFLAGVGLYGVIAWLVGRRTREIGVRLALGAQPGDVRRLVIMQSLKLSSIGSIIGVAGALALGRFMAAALYGVHASDPISLFAACAVIFLIALTASYVPALRASRVDPMMALRCE